jgi:chromosome segregation ATPase
MDIGSSETMLPPSSVPPGPPQSTSPTPVPSSIPSPTPAAALPSLVAHEDTTLHATPPTNITLLQAELTEALAKISSLTSDNDFLRGRYQEASAFVTSTQSELIALRESEAIARSQATDGVALVSGALQSRIAVLEAEVKRLEATVKLLERKDELTGDDTREKVMRVMELEEEVGRWRRRAGNAEREVERMKDVLETLEDGEYKPS